MSGGVRGKGRQPPECALKPLPLWGTEAGFSPREALGTPGNKSPYASELAHPVEEGAVLLPHTSHQSLAGAAWPAAVQVGGEAPWPERAFRSIG